MIRKCVQCEDIIHGEYCDTCGIDIHGREQGTKKPKGPLYKAENKVKKLEIVFNLELAALLLIVLYNGSVFLVIDILTSILTFILGGMGILIYQQLILSLKNKEYYSWISLLFLHIGFLIYTMMEGYKFVPFSIITFFVAVYVIIKLMNHDVRFLFHGKNKRIKVPDRIWN